MARYRIEVSCGGQLELVVEPNSHKLKNAVKWTRSLARNHKSCVVRLKDARSGKIVYA